MSVDLLRGELGEVPGLRLRPDEPMAQHTPLRVGGPAELWAVAEDIDALRLGIKAARRHRIPWRLHWPFQDWIVRDGVLAGLTVRPGRAFEGIERLALDRIRIHAASPWSSLAGLGSGWWDELSRWPGCPGGLLAEGQQARLTGMCREIAWYRARGTDRLDVEEGQTPPAQPRRERALIASQIMTTPVRLIRQDTTLLQAWQILQAARFRHLPVVNEGGFLVGILSERDLLREAGTPDHHPLQPVAGRPVSEIMRTRVFTARPEAPIRDLARLMIAENIGAVPIFDQGPGLDGIVTRGDVMRTLVHEAPLELWI